MNPLKNVNHLTSRRRKYPLLPTISGEGGAMPQLCRDRTSYDRNTNCQNWQEVQPTAAAPRTQRGHTKHLTG